MPFNIKHPDDKVLVCSDCGNEFLFTKRDQDFYAEKGFTPPKRCPKDRALRKQMRENKNQG